MTGHTLFAVFEQLAYAAAVFLSAVILFPCSTDAHVSSSSVSMSAAMMTLNVNLNII